MKQVKAYSIISKKAKKQSRITYKVEAIIGKRLIQQYERIN